jgi:hypothetical protein
VAVLFDVRGPVGGRVVPAEALGARVAGILRVPFAVACQATPVI